MAQLEVIKKRGVKPRWRLRDENGRVVPLRPGRVFLPATPVENRRVREAVDQVLTRMAADGAHAAEE